MNRDLAAWLALVLLAWFAALTYWLARVAELPPPARDGSTRHDPDMIVENFSTLRLGEDGQPKLSLAAVRMVHYPDDGSAELTFPRLTRFSADGPPVHAMASRGVVSKDGERVELFGDVRLVREAHGDRSELVLRTSHLEVFPERETARTDKPVEIRDAHGVLTGVGLEFDARTRVLRVLSRVKVLYVRP